MAHFTPGLHEWTHGKERPSAGFEPALAVWWPEGLSPDAASICYCVKSSVFSSDRLPLPVTWLERLDCGSIQLTTWSRSLSLATASRGLAGEGNWGKGEVWGEGINLVRVRWWTSGSSSLKLAVSRTKTNTTNNGPRVRLVILRVAAERN